MTLIEHLRIIDELVLNRAAPAEIREHIVAMWPALEAYDETLAKCAALEQSNAAAVTKAQALESELAQLKTKPKPNILYRGIGP